MESEKHYFSALPQNEGKERASSVDPINQSNKELDAEAQDSLKAKKFERAAYLFNLALSRDPQDGEAWNGLGTAQRQMGNDKESVSDLEAAVKLRPEERDYWFALGLAYASVRKEEQATKAFQQVVGLDPNYAAGWYELGKSYSNSEQASRCFKEASTLEPNNPIFFFALGRSLPLGDEKTAAYRKALEIKPDYPDAVYALAEDYESEGHYDEGIALRKILISSKLDQNVFFSSETLTEADCWYGLGEDYAQLREFKDAEQAYLKANNILDDHKILEYEVMKRDENLRIRLASSLAIMYDRWGKHKQSDKWMSYSSMLSRHMLKPPELEH